MLINKGTTPSSLAELQYSSIVALVNGSVAAKGHGWCLVSVSVEIDLEVSVLAHSLERVVCVSRNVLFVVVVELP